jgi:fatty-acyl-CoA synthase
MSNIPELLNEVSKTEKPFLISNGEVVTYRDFVRKTDEVATAFIELGLKRGDRIAIIALNQLEWLYTFFAANRIGVGVVALNVRYREAELKYMLNNSSAKAVVSLPEFGGFDYVSFFRQSDFPKLEHHIYLGDVDNAMSFRDLFGGVDSEAIGKMEKEVSDNDTSVIIYTSGTTGRPKGANITHKSILSSSKAQTIHTSCTDSDTVMGHMPLNHVGGLSCGILTAMHALASVVLIPVFIPNTVLDAIQRNGATILGGVPTMFQMFFNTNFDDYDVSSLRLVIIGGSNAPPELLRKIREKFPKAKIMNLYGLSESSGACICSPLEDDVGRLMDKRGMPLLGIPLNEYEVRVVDDEGKPLPDGEVGEIAVKGDCVCNGYIGLEDKTREAFKDGWLLTGDLGYKRGNFVYFMGRKKEMYVQAGYNVYPAEIENVLLTHPKVYMVAVIGVKDEFYGEKGVAFVIPKGEVNEEELREYCAKYIADYKIPKKFVFTTSLPLTPAGKIQKSELLKMYEEG